ncbi:dienelactone hydrolase-like enzyme [Thioflavicoccus mobilis 8321]|uniref:Dienelactone hydrolase-like enzyme n=1 Tax=Thioflavicoccus mobilis 8321 TaxID=765912 RepID=L0H0Q8_9GAMM|nr:dienelactone hydrolase family protein [Thioflavicoccus mobilis]AGA91169.1 dienelactone hydrolase-like enzyme [Thioflavicoccus mobilis 8321]
MPTAMRFLLLGLFLLPLTAPAALIKEPVEYQDGDTTLRGYLVYDEALPHKRPGILIAHEWWGLNDFVRERAERLADLGYVTFALDMYGDGRVTEHSNEASAWMQQMTANQEAWRHRALLGLEILKRHPMVDAERIAAIGFCFGGGTVMQLAYAGADLDGVVSFHGPLTPAANTKPGDIKASILVAHGEDDSFVPSEQIAVFKAALDAAQADWQMIIYGGARHAFTNPNADSYGIDNVRYDPLAAKRSWALMRVFLDEVFTP